MSYVWCASSGCCSCPAIFRLTFSQAALAIHESNARAAYAEQLAQNEIAKLRVGNEQEKQQMEARLAAADADPNGMDPSN